MGDNGELQAFDANNIRQLMTAETENLFEQLRNLDEMWVLVASQPQWQDKKTTLEFTEGDDLERMERQLKDIVTQNEASGRCSIIYLVQPDNEIPLVVTYKHKNYAVLDPTGEHWTLSTNLDCEKKDLTIGRIVEDMNGNLRNNLLANKAMVIGISGEDFLSRKERMSQRRCRTIAPGKRSRARPQIMPPVYYDEEEFDC